MQPTGGTDQSVGLRLGMAALLVGGPLNTPAEDSNSTYNRVIILLSDGLNTGGPLARTTATVVRRRRAI